MTETSKLPFSTRLVLRDLRSADQGEIMLGGISDLIDAGVMRLGQTHHRLVVSKHTLEPAGSLSNDTEPLSSIATLLSTAREQADSNEIEKLANWIAEHAPQAVGTAVERTVDWLLAGGYLEEKSVALQIGGKSVSRSHELVRTDRGLAEIAGMPPRATSTAARREKSDRYGSDALHPVAPLVMASAGWAAAAGGTSG